MFEKNKLTEEDNNKAKERLRKIEMFKKYDFIEREKEKQS